MLETLNLHHTKEKWTNQYWCKFKNKQLQLRIIGIVIYSAKFHLVVYLSLLLMIAIIQNQSSEVIQQWYHWNPSQESDDLVNDLVPDQWCWSGPKLSSWRWTVLHSSAVDDRGHQLERLSCASMQPEKAFSERPTTTAVLAAIEWLLMAANCWHEDFLLTRMIGSLLRRLLVQQLLP